MTKLEYQEQRLALQEELTTLVNQSETRALEDAENTRLAEIKAEIDKIDDEIRKLETENQKIAKNNEVKIENKKMAKRMKLIDAINDVIARRNFSDDAQANINAAKDEFRACGIDAQGDIQIRSTLQDLVTVGQEDIATELRPIEVAVRNNSISNKMGAAWLTNLKGDVSIPRYSGSNVGWAGEIAEAQDGAGTFDNVLLSPHRLTAFVEVSKQLLIQGSDDVEAMLVNDIAKAVAEKLDESIFSDFSGTTEQPEGIFYSVSADTGTTLSSVTYGDVLDLELAVEEANGSDYMFVVNPKVKFALKGVQKANGLNMIVEGKELDGYDYISSNSVVDNGIVCLNPRSLVIGQWGGYDITIDPYSKAKNATVVLTINAWFDFALRNDMAAAAIYA